MCNYAQELTPDSTDARGAFFVGQEPRVIHSNAGFHGLRPGRREGRLSRPVLRAGDCEGLAGWVGLYTAGLVE